MTSLRIASWNIAGGRRIRSDKEWDYDGVDLDYFAGVLRHLQLDTVCLQEVEGDEQDSTAKRLAKMLDLPYVFETLMSDSHMDRSKSLFNAIISRRPFTNARAVVQPYPAFELTLPNGQPAAKHDKYLQIVEFEGGLHVANTQNQPLSSLGQSYEHAQGVQYAGELAEMYRRQLRPPLTFVGDFNTPNPSETFQSLIESLSLADIVPPEPTRPNSTKHTDCIFISPELSSSESQIIKTETDHYLVWADVQFAGNDKA